MRKFLLFAFFISCFLTSISQPFWSENFGLGCSQGTFASGFSGTAGTWTVTNTGTNNNYANEFFISATEAGTGVGNCGDGCLDTPALINRTLHIGNAEVTGIVDPDNGASYNTGGTCSPPFNICVATDKRVESPSIDCSGHTNLMLYFNYMESGDGINDNASLWYYDGSAWALLEDLPKTTVVCPSGQGLWTAYSVQLPLSAENNPNVKIGFRWVNNDDATGTDPSFAVDDIYLDFTDPTGVSENNSLLSKFEILNENQLRLSCQKVNPGTYYFEIVNSIGQVVLSEKLRLEAGDFSKAYNLNSLSNGLYIANFSNGFDTENSAKFVLTK